MKTITIEEQEFEVPDWVRWVAMNEDGEWLGFDLEPCAFLGIWVPHPDNKDIVRIKQSNCSWRESLREVS